MNLSKIKAIEAKNKKRILSLDPNVPEKSGIYILTREENGFKYAYIGQAKNILSRLASHLSGYQHIDLSIKKHGLFNAENPTGWQLTSKECRESDLDDIEQEYIKFYANAGYQMRNKTSGSQSKGKLGIADNKPSKGYYDGIARGKAIVGKFIRDLFNEKLRFEINGEKTIRKSNAYKKFEKFLEEISEV